MTELALLLLYTHTRPLLQYKDNKGVRFQENKLNSIPLI